MTEVIGLWLAEVYLLSTVVLIAACVAMRLLRQPARRLFVARCTAVGLVGLIGASTWSSPAENIAPSPSSMTDVSTLRDAEQDLSPANRLAIGCALTPPEPRLEQGCPDAKESLPVLASAGCEPVAIVESPQESQLNTPGITLAFLTGFGMTIVWLLAGACAAARLLGRTMEAPGALRTKLANVVGEGHRAPRLRLGAGAGQPFVIGVLRPTIVLPARFAGEGEPEDRIEAALRHEWAHIRNGDLALLALLRGLLPFLFAHPAYWWLRRQVRADQEALADAQAVRDGDRLGYAEALLAWARATPAGAGRSHAGALALWDRPSELRRRIALLLSPQFQVESRCPLHWRILVATIAATVILPLAGLSMTGAEASATAPSPPHDCADCEGHTPPSPPLTIFCCPPDTKAGPAAELSSS